MHRHLKIIIPAMLILAATGCQPVMVRHQVDPIHITLDVNLKVDRELDEFFDFEQEIEEQIIQTEAPGMPEKDEAGTPPADAPPPDTAPPVDDNEPLMEGIDE